MSRSTKRPSASIDDAGDILKVGKAQTEPEAIVAWLNAIGLEAGPLSPWLYARRGDSIHSR